MKYISEKIGSDYMTWCKSIDKSKTWQNGDSIFITSPTGTGKSTFVFKDLLKHYKENGKRILYLVNRSVLKEQLEDSLDEYIEYRNYITIMLYQELEEEIRALYPVNSNMYPGVGIMHYVPQNDNRHWLQFNRLDIYDCVVCDEAHYFLMDSNYNTNTILSFKYINTHFHNKIRIFMSATIDDIKCCIEEYNLKAKYARTEWLELNSNIPIDYFNSMERNSWEYGMSFRNEDINVKMFKTKDEIIEEIGRSTDKWLVFVDNKEYGRRLKTIIELQFEANEANETVNFIWSNYKDDTEAWGEVETISQKERQDSTVLIATSVLDNGVNFKDANLRNIVIFADTKVEFLQMLGRKRKDGMPINLYILQLSKYHFEKRLRICKQRFKYIDANYKYLCNNIQLDFDRMKEMAPFWNSNFTMYQQMENDILRQQNIFLMHDMLNNYGIQEAVKATYLFYGGMLLPNMLSMRNIQNLIKYYIEVIDAFEREGENAFLQMQLMWLGMTTEEAEKIITEELLDKAERSRAKIIKKLDQLVVKLEGKPHPWTEIRSELTLIKDNLKKDFQNILYKDHYKYKTFYAITYKNNDNCTKPFVKYLSEYCGIPFILVKEGSNYAFRRIEQPLAPETTSQE